MRPFVRRTKAELAALPEYSCSLPTGTTIGKRWKRNKIAYAGPPPGCRLPEGAFVGPEWWMGEYHPSSEPDTIDIHWSPILVVDEPAVEWPRAF